MESLIIQNTEDTPQIEFDLGTGIFTISGRSLPENAIEFYKPVLEWLETVLKETTGGNYVLEIKLEYFNTASSKQLAKTLLMVEKYNETNNILIRWYYEKEDNDMLVSGNQYSKFLKLKFEFIEY